MINIERNFEMHRAQEKVIMIKVLNGQERGMHVIFKWPGAGHYALIKPMNVQMAISL